MAERENAVAIYVLYSKGRVGGSSYDGLRWRKAQVPDVVVFARAVILCLITLSLESMFYETVTNGIAEHNLSTLLSRCGHVWSCEVSSTALPPALPFLL